MEYESQVQAAKNLKWEKAQIKKIEKMTGLHLYQLEVKRDDIGKPKAE